MDLTALKTEIVNDPMGMGYSGKSSKEIAALLNTVGGSGEFSNNGVIDSYEIVNNLDPTDLYNLSVDQKSTLQLILSAGKVDSSNSNVLNIFKNLFGAGTTTRTNLINLSKKSTSRASIIGLGEITPWDVELATSK